MKIVLISINTDSDFWIYHKGEHLPISIQNNECEIYIRGNSATLFHKLYDLAYVNLLELGSNTSKHKGPSGIIWETIQEYTNSYRYGRDQNICKDFGNYSISIREVHEKEIVRLII